MLSRSGKATKFPWPINKVHPMADSYTISITSYSLWVILGLANLSCASKSSENQTGSLSPFCILHHRIHFYIDKWIAHFLKYYCEISFTVSNALSRVSHSFFFWIKIMLYYDIVNWLLGVLFSTSTFHRIIWEGLIWPGIHHTFLCCPYHVAFAAESLQV